MTHDDDGRGGLEPVGDIPIDALGDRRSRCHPTHTRPHRWHTGRRPTCTPRRLRRVRRRRGVQGETDRPAGADGGARPGVRRSRAHTTPDAGAIARARPARPSAGQPVRSLADATAASRPAGSRTSARSSCTSRRRGSPARAAKGKDGSWRVSSTEMMIRRVLKRLGLLGHPVFHEFSPLNPSRNVVICANSGPRDHAYVVPGVIRHQAIDLSSQR